MPKNLIKNERGVKRKVALTAKGADSCSSEPQQKKKKITVTIKNEVKEIIDLSCETGTSNSASFQSENGLKVDALTKRIKPKSCTNTCEVGTSHPPSSYYQKSFKSNILTTSDISEPVCNRDKANVSVGWKTEVAVADEIDLDVQIVKVVIKLLDNKCTIPFIARYRKNQTSNLDVKKLIQIEDQCTKYRNIQKKVENSIKILKKKNVTTKSVYDALNLCKSPEEIQHIMAPYKEGVPRTYADRALSVGLGVPAMKLLEEGINLKDLELFQFLKRSKDLKTTDDIMNGIQHIIVNVIAKDLDVIATARKHCTNQNIRLHSTENKQSAKNKTKDAEKCGKQDNFSLYYSISYSIAAIKSHQVLAINRGEKLKQLKVNVDIPYSIKHEIITQAKRKWMNKIENRLNEQSSKFLLNCLNQSYVKFIEPLLSRLVRAQLSAKAENDSINVFMENLKNLLLTPPLRGETVLAIDPGFINGCKVAVTSPNGDIIATHVIHLFPAHKQQDARTYLIQTVKTYSVKTIAIGNGKGCRETETFISHMIQTGCFKPENVRYCIISEQGISIFSVCDIAISEMPELDPTVRSAVSLAKRLQDPLSEYIKVDPKHLGIGMYQHDVSQKKLETALDTVVIQCVSFVGVDLNTSSEYLLRKVSGLNSLSAKNIIEWRKTNGYFCNREQLLLVKGIGKKTYEQCAGFIKILPHTCNPTNVSMKCKKSESIKNFNPLDTTCIHPESYPQTLKLLKTMKCDVKEIGSKDFIGQVDSFLKETSVSELCVHLGLDQYTLNHILDNLKRPAADIRPESSSPIFKQNVMKIEDMKAGDAITGQVTNVTNFGSFVDIGVEKNGLIHTSKLKKGITLKIGDKVKIKVIFVDIAKQRVSLQFLDFI